MDLLEGFGNLSLGTTTRNIAERAGNSLVSEPEFFLGMLTVKQFQDAFPTWDTEFIWGRQRGVNPDIVSLIVDDLTLPGREGIRLMNLNITIGTVNHHDARIMDGQHRLHALMSSMEDIKFMLSIVNFKDDDARFLEFIKINSNTPLPEFYKSITGYDSYCQKAATQIVEAMRETYPELFSPIPKVYYLHQQTLVEQFYTVFQKHRIPMAPDEIEQHLQMLFDVLLDPSVFPSQITKYPVPVLDIRRCKSQKRVGEPTLQCPHQGKAEHGGFCGIHKTGRTPFNGIHLRNTRHQELAPHGTLFVLNPDWIDKAVENVALRACFSV